MLKIRKLEKKEPVYDISVEGNENFYANDINVHNCSKFWSSL
jgi:intein/homing endonuclease